MQHCPLQMYGRCSRAATDQYIVKVLQRCNTRLSYQRSSTTELFSAFRATKEASLSLKWPWQRGWCAHLFLQLCVCVCDCTMANYSTFHMKFTFPKSFLCSERLKEKKRCCTWMWADGERLSFCICRRKEKKLLRMFCVSKVFGSAGLKTFKTDITAKLSGRKQVNSSEQEVEEERGVVECLDRKLPFNVSAHRYHVHIMCLLSTFHIRRWAVELLEPTSRLKAWTYLWFYSGDHTVFSS